MSIYLTDHQINIPIDIEQINIPIVYNSFVSENGKRLIGPQMHSELSHKIISKLDIFGYLFSINNLRFHGISVNDTNFDRELDYYSNLCVTCFGSLANKILLVPRSSSYSIILS